MNKEKLVYLDTDMGLGTPRAELDDAAALITLLGSSRVNLIAAGSVFGNVPCRDATTNLARGLSTLSSKAKMGRGATRPLTNDMAWFNEWQRGYGRTPEWLIPEQTPDVVDLILQNVRTQPYQVTLLAIGPLTNLAAAIHKAPEIIPLVKEVVAMGGSFGTHNSAPEFNMRCDPEAADVVLSAGWPVTLIGLDVTRQVRFTQEELSLLTEWNPFITLLKDQAPAWIDRVESMGWEKGGCSLHDAVAAAYVIVPSLFSIISKAVSIELVDPVARGLARFMDGTNKESNVRVVTDLDINAVHQLIIKALNHEEYS